MPRSPGTCRDCGSDPEPGKTRCRPCAARRRKVESARRDARRAAGQCLVCGAPVARQKRVNGSAARVREPARYCTAHLRYYAERAAEAEEASE